MNDRLAHLRFIPPPINTPWTCAIEPTFQSIVTRSDGAHVAMKTPLFWHDPMWCEMPLNQADCLAVAIAELDVIVSALRRDLSPPNQTSQFHGGPKKIVGVNDESDSQSQTIFPRIVPYRPERYGLSVRDFDDAAVIDVRLTMPRDAAGRFAFSPEQIRRWEATPPGESLAGGGWVPAATFPPDVISLKHLSRKLDQLRELAPSAAVFVSLEPYRRSEELSRVLAARPDGVILRMDGMNLDGLRLAKLVQWSRQEINAAGTPGMPLWIVPGEVTADDVVKFIELGATAVAIDAWCDELIAEAEDATAHTVSSELSDPHEPISIDSQYLHDLAAYRLSPKISRVMGLGYSLGRVTKSERLGSFDATWASELGVKEL